MAVVVPKERTIEPTLGARERALSLAPRLGKRGAQRAQLERLRAELAEPCALEDRELVTLLAYAAGGDGDPIVGLLEEARATVAVLSESEGGADERTLLCGVERRIATALELYARATAR